MLSFDNAVNILNKLPVELVSLTFNYLDGLDMVNFINDNKEAYIYDLNITKNELNIWTLIKNSKSSLDANNKIAEWCKILFRANVNCLYYKQEYYKFQSKYYKKNFMLPTDTDKKYNKKLYIGLFLYFGVNIEKAYEYSSLSSDKIEMIFNIMAEMPEQFNIKILNTVINFSKELESKEKYINYAVKIKKIYSIIKEDYMYIKREHLKKVVLNFSDESYQRLISLLESNISFAAAFVLSNSLRKFTDALINKFKQLNEEFSGEFNIPDDILVIYLQDDKAISNIRLFKSKNISPNGTIDLLSLNKDLLDYIIKNNIIYDLDYFTWAKLKPIFYNYLDIFQQIFTKFTYNQKYNIRMKELMADGGYDKLMLTYIKENIDKIHLYCTTLNTLITPSQYFQVYTELTDFQMNTFYGFIKLNLTFAQALSNTYQTVEYNQ